MRRRIFVLTLIAALAAMLAAAPAAMAQDVKAEALPGGKANAQAGSEEVQSKADPECADAKAGGTAAKACSKPEEKPPPPPPPPKAAPPPPPKAAPPPPPPKAAPAPPAPPPKQLPPSGGAGIASLLGLGAGTLLVGGGLLARRWINR